MAEGNQLLRGSLEVEAFRRNYSALYDALEQADLAGGLSMKLYSVAIISGESMDVLQQAMLPRGQKARLLLQAVERSIKTDNSAFWTFVAVLEKERVLVHTAELLRLHYDQLSVPEGLPESSSSEGHQCYRDLVSEARLPESLSSGFDTDSTEQHQAIGQGTPKKSGAGNEQLESSSATVEFLECSVLGQSEQKAGYNGEECTRTKRRIEDLERKFVGLVERTQTEVMKLNPDLDEFRIKIILLPASLKEEHQQYIKDNLPQLYDAKSIPEIFGLLSLYWNYLHYGLLQHIIAIYGSDGLKKLMKSYIKDVKSFRQETTLAMYWLVQPMRSKCPIWDGKNIEALGFRIHTLGLRASNSLECIEGVRQKYARTVSLPDFVFAIKDFLPG